MSSRASAGEELIAFDAAVECRVLAGAVGLQLRGTARAAAAGQSITEVLFAGMAGLAAPPPARLHEVRVLQMFPPQGFCIEAREGRFALQARSVQLHREIAAAFFASVPSPVVPRATRLGWSMLLTALRVPGLARLLGRRGEQP